MRQVVISSALGTLDTKALLVLRMPGAELMCLNITGVRILRIVASKLSSAPGTRAVVRNCLKTNHRCTLSPAARGMQCVLARGVGQIQEKRPGVCTVCLHAHTVFKT